jgi:Tol biopolymer transport system component
MRFVLATPGGVSLGSGTVDQDVAISPDGSLIAYTGTAATGGSPQVYIRSMDEPESAPVMGALGHNPFFSPDGAWIGFVDAADPRTLKRVPTRGGTPETITTLPPGVPYVAGATWGDDGQIIVGTGAAWGLYRVTSGGGDVERLSEGQHHWPSLIDGRDAVLIMSHDAGMSLALVDLSTGEEKPLGIEGTSPRYVPTGHLLYATADGAVWAAAFDVASLRVTGSPVRVLSGVDVKSLTEGAANFAVSDNGRVVYAAGTPLSEFITNLVAVAADGSRSILAQLDGIAWYPRFSPDGSRVAFGLSRDNNTAGGSDLWVLDVARGAQTRVTFGGNNRFLPVWSPDGTRLTHADGILDENRILSTAADGSGVSDTLLPLDVRRFPTSWSPDGRTLAYYAGGAVGGSRDLWLLHLDGDRREPERFVSTPFTEAGAIFSPDGRWLAYVSDRSGRNEVYARPVDRSGAEVTVSVGGGAEPVWAPSGNGMYYKHEGDLMMVAIDETVSGLNVGTPQRVLEDRYRRDTSGAPGTLANYDAMPGGAGFVMVEDSSPEDAAAHSSARLRLVLNWFEELRARAPS